MTQYEFDRLPLLLRPAEAMMALAGVKRNDFYEMRKAGDLRVFQPDPAHAFAYYYKADVGRAAGLKMDPKAWMELPERLNEFQFKHVTGLSDLAILQGIASGQLRDAGKNGMRLFARADLSAWCLTREALKRET
jgi:hypothetical protein